MAKAQVIKKNKSQGEIVTKALEIATNFKVLPYDEVTRRLDEIASDYSLARAAR